MNIDVWSKLQKLESYAAQGKWNNVIEFASHYKAAAALAVQPQQCERQFAELAFTTYKVLALMRLRRLNLAGDELAQLGDLPARQLSTGCQCGVPFGLLYLRAQLPACLGSPQITQDLLYQLRDYCRRQQQQQQQTQQQGEQSIQQHWPENEPGQQQQQQQQQQDVVHGVGPHDQQVAAIQTECNGVHQKQRPEHLRPAVSANAAQALWRQRLHAVDCSLILHHWQQGSVAIAIKLLDEQLRQQPDSLELWSLAGRLQLQLNMLQQAHASFSRLQRLAQHRQRQLQHQQRMATAGACESQQVIALQQLVHHNWGCFHAMHGNMTSAMHEFNAAQQACAASIATGAAAAAADPLFAADGINTQNADNELVAAVDGVAAANTAVCQLHMGQLTEAISSLEAGLQQHLPAFLQECTLFNLGMMYDLAYPPAIAKQTKHQLANSVLRLAADDFDRSCIEPRGQQ